MENQQCKTSVKSSYKYLLSKSDETEKEICVFYAKLLKTLHKNSYRSVDLIRSSLRKIRSYNNRDLEEHKSVSFDKGCDRLAYIFAYGAIHSTIMYDHFSKMLKTKKNMLKKIIEMEDISLCFLGGGPGLEAVSASKLFNDIIAVCKSGKSKPLNVYVTIVDICPHWKKEAETILTDAQNSLCDSTNVQIHFSFLEADLTSDFTKDLRKVIKKAHIVTMFKFLSDVSEASYSDQEIPDMINVILKCMSLKACLFYLDTAGGGVFNKFDRLIEKHSSTVRIYGPAAHNSHLLSLDSIDKLRVFSNMECTTRCTISCSAWLKADSCNIVVLPIQVLDDQVKPEVKKKEPKIKKIVQSSAKFRDIYDSCSDRKEKDNCTTVVSSIQVIDNPVKPKLKKKETSVQLLGDQVKLKKSDLSIQLIGDLVTPKLKKKERKMKKVEQSFAKFRDIECNSSD